MNQFVKMGKCCANNECAQKVNPEDERCFFLLKNLVNKIWLYSNGRQKSVQILVVKEITFQKHISFILHAFIYIYIYKTRKQGLCFLNWTGWEFWIYVLHNVLFLQDIAIAAMGPIQGLPDYNWFRRRTYLNRY
jgi:hypothetical protein